MGKRFPATWLTRRTLALFWLCVGLAAGISALPAGPLVQAQTTSEQWTATGLTSGAIAAIAIDPSNPRIIYATNEGSFSGVTFKTTDGGQNWNTLSGGANTLAIDPSNTNIIYAGSAYGVLKSIDGGANWTGLPSIGASHHTALAIDPTNTNTVYAGVSYGWGVFKTTTGGSSWTNVLDSNYVIALVLAPTAPQVIYVGTWDYYDTPGGVWKSSDAGMRWTRVMTNAGINALAVDPQDMRVVYAATEGEGVLKSSDGGTTWNSINNGLHYRVVRALAIDPIHPRIVYAGTWEGGVFRSLDSGASWTAMNTAGLTNSYIEALAIDPTDTSVLYAGTRGGGVFKWVGTLPPPSGSTYAQVLDGAGQPMAGALVYHNGNLVTNEQGTPKLSDAAGNVLLEQVQAGDTLAALLPQEQRASVRQAHNGWAYRIYTTNMRVTSTGGLQSFRVVNPGGPQPLTVQPEQVLTLFNLLVSIEWDASDEYMAEIARAMSRASDYLYDVSDGQMAFGQVMIYDQGRHWADADLQIATNNIVRPHAYVGGIIAEDKAHVMRIGRQWDGNSGNQGPWDRPDGYRTIVHEFGHYALHLYDEYFAFVFDQRGNLIGEQPASCTGPENHDPVGDATNASMMDYQYSSSELPMRDVPGLWSQRCQATAQWQMNGESAWETLVRRYADTQNPARWRFTTPATRGVMAGPSRLPSEQLNLPRVEVVQAGEATALRRLTVYDPGGIPLRGAIIALYKPDGRVIGQGFSDGNGQIEVYGASSGDTLRAASFDGGLSGSVIVGTDIQLSLTLQPVRGAALQADAGIPHLRVFAAPAQDANTITLLVALINFGPDANPGMIVTAPGSEAGYAPTLNYTGNGYEGRISFSATERGTGRIQALGGASNRLLRLYTSYRLQRVDNTQSHEVFSDDGNLSLQLAAGSLQGNETYLVVAPPGAIPGPLPNGRVLVGDSYSITASGAQETLAQAALLRLRYDRALLGQQMQATDLGIYRWDVQSGTWQAVASSLDEEHKALAVSVTALGVYALLGPGPSASDPTPSPTPNPDVPDPTPSPTPKPNVPNPAPSPQTPERILIPLVRH